MRSAASPTCFTFHCLMKPGQILALAGISMLAMSNSCEKQPDVSPTGSLVTARILGTETTVDGNYKNERTRWTVDIAPLSLPGWAGLSYQQAKVFDLPTDGAYRAGSTVTFYYQLVPLAQETPWRTFGAWKSMAATRTGTDALPEITVSDVKLISPQ